ncbi:MAG TPA: DUF5985 family protein [Stellaceae bacterium]|jgi:hypothetical protein|nr:DUF5985 family protein [Stellaceae bacterium]
MIQYPEDFVLGAAAMGYLIVGLFFFRFWRQTSDGLFLTFAAAFWVLAASEAAFSFGLPRGAGWIYVLRLAAFVLIIGAILGKNLGRAGGKPPGNLPVPPLPEAPRGLTKKAPP